VVSCGCNAFIWYGSEKKNELGKYISFECQHPETIGQQSIQYLCTYKEQKVQPPKDPKKAYEEAQKMVKSNSEKWTGISCNQLGLVFAQLAKDQKILIKLGAFIHECPHHDDDNVLGKIHSNFQRCCTLLWKGLQDPWTVDKLLSNDDGLTDDNPGNREEIATKIVKHLLAHVWASLDDSCVNLTVMCYDLVSSAQMADAKWNLETMMELDPRLHEIGNIFTTPCGLGVESWTRLVGVTRLRFRYVFMALKEINTSIETSSFGLGIKLITRRGIIRSYIRNCLKFLALTMDDTAAMDAACDTKESWMTFWIQALTKSSELSTLQFEQHGDEYWESVQKEKERQFKSYIVKDLKTHLGEDLKTIDPDGTMVKPALVQACIDMDVNIQKKCEADRKAKLDVSISSFGNEIQSAMTANATTATTATATPNDANFSLAGEQNPAENGDDGFVMTDEAANDQSEMIMKIREGSSGEFVSFIPQSLDSMGRSWSVYKKISDAMLVITDMVTRQVSGACDVQSDRLFFKVGRKPEDLFKGKPRVYCTFSSAHARDMMQLTLPGRIVYSQVACDQIENTYIKIHRNHETRRHVTQQTHLNQ